MSQRNSVVQLNRPHKMYRGDRMKYAATYKHGNTTIHIVAPPPMAEEDKQKVIRDMHMAGWAIIDEIIEKGNPEQIDRVFGPGHEFLYKQV